MTLLSESQTRSVAAIGEPPREPAAAGAARVAMLVRAAVASVEPFYSCGLGIGIKATQVIVFLEA